MNDNDCTQLHNLPDFRGRPLISAGTGLSFLDGLVRAGLGDATL